MTRIRFSALPLLLGFATVGGCRLRAPCGIMPEDAFLTTVPGVLHVRLVKYAPCSFPVPDGFVEEEAVIEVNIGTQSFFLPSESDSWVAESLGSTGLDEYNPPDYILKFRQAKSRIVVREKPTDIDGIGRTGSGRKVFSNIPEFLPPPEQNPGRAGPNVNYEADGVISFYSGANDQVYFLYPADPAERDENFKIASCSLDGDCAVSDVPEGVDLSRIDTSRSDARVYDGAPRTSIFAPAPVGVVALPVQCCVCQEYAYYGFQGDTLTGSLELLDGVRLARAVDKRIGTVYAVTGSITGLQLLEEVLETEVQQELLIDEQEIAGAFY